MYNGGAQQVCTPTFRGFDARARQVTLTGHQRTASPRLSAPLTTHRNDTGRAHVVDTVVQVINTTCIDDLLTTYGRARHLAHSLPELMHRPVKLVGKAGEQQDIERSDTASFSVHCMMKCTCVAALALRT